MGSLLLGFPSLPIIYGFHLICMPSFSNIHHKTHRYQYLPNQHLPSVYNRVALTSYIHYIRLFHHYYYLIPSLPLIRMRLPQFHSSFKIDTYYDIPYTSHRRQHYLEQGTISKWRINFNSFNALSVENTHLYITLPELSESEWGIGQTENSNSSRISKQGERKKGPWMHGILAGHSSNNSNYLPVNIPEFLNPFQEGKRAGVLYLLTNTPESISMSRLPYTSPICAQLIKFPTHQITLVTSGRKSYP